MTMKTIANTLQFLSAISCVLLLTGCVSRTLAPDGVYQDIILYQADSIVDQTVITMEAYQAWAVRNPAYLADSQTAGRLLAIVNAELDGIAKPNEILVQAIQARDLYAQIKSVDTANSLQHAVELVRQLSTQLLPVMFPDGEINF